MNVAIRSLNWIVGQYVRARRDVVVGSGSRVNWWRLRHARGKLIIGRDSIVACRIDFDHEGGAVSIGSGSYIGASHLVCHTGITIDDDVIISWGVTIVDHDSHSLKWHIRRDDVRAWHNAEKSWRDVGVRPVHICRGAWIGCGALILKGVTIGEGAVVGASAVITHDVGPYTLVAGNPATVIRELARFGTD